MTKVRKVRKTGRILVGQEFAGQRFTVYYLTSGDVLLRVVDASKEAPKDRTSESICGSRKDAVL